MDKTWTRAVDFMQRYGSLSLPLRLLVGAFVSAIAGAGLGVLAEYAAYRYAYYYGIRPPLEGIPYLRLAITGMTVASLAGAALSFALVYVLAMLLVSQIEGAIGNTRIYLLLIELIARRSGVSSQVNVPRPETLVGRLRLLPIRWAVILAAGFGLVPGVIMAFVLWLQGEPLWPAAAAVLYIASGVLLLWNRQVAWWFAVAAMVLVVAVVPLLLFNVSVYGAILRGLGYGGGLPVTLVLVDAPASGDQNLEAALLLRTSAAVIVFDHSHRRIREVQLSRVQFIDHPATPLRERKVMLPW